MFPSVERNGVRLIDGGVGSNTPISVAVDLGAERVVVLPAGFSCSLKKPPRSVFGTIANSLNHIMTRQLATEIEFYRTKAKLHVAPALCPLEVSSGDFTQTELLMTDGYKPASGWIEAGGLKRALPSNLHLHPAIFMTLHLQHARITL